MPVKQPTIDVINNLDRGFNNKFLKEEKRF